MTRMTDDAHRELIRQAVAARDRALAPYSNFKVGAALESGDGRIFTGCNIENASYGLTMCAERVALYKGLSEGARDFKRIVVVTPAAKPAALCGSCRQLLWEYCGNIEVVLCSLTGDNVVLMMDQLLPRPFDDRDLSGS
jgi:cytidine deaminase